MDKMKKFLALSCTALVVALSATFLAACEDGKDPSATTPGGTTPGGTTPPPATTGYNVDASWAGTYASKDGATTVEVAEHSIKLNNTEIEEVTESTEGGKSYSFTLTEHEYTLSLGHATYGAGHLLVLSDDTADTSVYVATSFDVTFGAEYVASWYALDGTELKVEAKAVKVVEPGDGESEGTETASEFVVNAGAAYLVKMAGSASVEALTYSQENVEFTFGGAVYGKYQNNLEIPAEWKGTWNKIGGTGTLEIGDDFKVDGKAYAINESATFMLNGKIMSAHIKGDYIMEIWEEHYDESDLLTGYDITYYIKSDYAEISVTDSNLLNTKWYAANVSTFEISAEGKVKWGTVDGKVFATEEHDGENHSYSVMLGNMAYDFYLDGDDLWLEPYTGDTVVFDNGTVKEAYRGTWEFKSNEVVATGTIVIGENTSKVGDDNGTAPRRTRTGYTFSVTDSEGATTVYNVALLTAEEGNVFAGGKILAVTVSANTQYYLKQGTVSISDSVNAKLTATWKPETTGASSVNIDGNNITVNGIAATLLNKELNEIDSKEIYTVYVNGELYLLIYDETADKLTLHPYGGEVENDVVMIKDIPPKVTVDTKYAGTYSDNEHTVVVDGEGNFKFDNTAYDLTYDSSMHEYYFRMSGYEYTVLFSDSSVSVFSSAADNSWELKKIPEGAQKYTLTVTYEASQGTVTVSPQSPDNQYYENSTVKLTIVAQSGYELDKVTVNGDDATVEGGKCEVTITAATTVEVKFKSKATAEENLLTDKYIGVYKSIYVGDGALNSITITSEGVTAYDGESTQTFTADQITSKGNGEFELKNQECTIILRFSDSNLNAENTTYNFSAIDGDYNKQGA